MGISKVFLVGLLMIICKSIAGLGESSILIVMFLHNH